MHPGAHLQVAEMSVLFASPISAGLSWWYQVGFLGFKYLKSTWLPLARDNVYWVDIE